VREWHDIRPTVTFSLLYASTDPYLDSW